MEEFYNETLFPHKENYQYIYKMPNYKLTPFKKANVSKDDYTFYTKLRKLSDLICTNLPNDFNRYTYKTYNTIMDTLRTNEVGLSEDQIEIVAALMDALSNFGTSFLLDVSPRNMGLDENGNMVLLDIAFDFQAAQKLRTNKRPNRYAY